MQKPCARKLHLGCGAHVLRGWLNADLDPVSPDIVRLDLTQALPFDAESFDYIFSEHVIEHLSHARGRKMLEECHRVLSPGGKIRISTPDLAFLIRLHDAELSDVQRRYIEWAVATFVPWAPFASSTFVINNFVRDWGHQFIYDEPVLRASLRAAGFGLVERCDLNESQDPNLRALENEARLPNGFLRLETFTLEAMKRAA